MKKSMTLLILLMGLFAGLWAETVTIGTGTTSGYYPLGSFYGYMRSSSLYTAAEIGSTGMISQLGWQVATAGTAVVPMKIYLKTVTSETQTAATWADLINGATLVYDAGVTSSPIGWKTLDITPYSYTSGNLMVLCEANYGGTGASPYPKYNYTAATGMHQSQQVDTTPPTAALAVNANRPNIQINIQAAGPYFTVSPASKNFGNVALNGVSEPQVFTVKNSGTGTLTINSALIVGGGGDALQFEWTDANTYPVALTAGQTMTVSVKFKPTSYGVKTTTLTFSGDAKVDHNVVLTGTCTPPVLFTDSFENYTDFALEFSPWTVADLDTHKTYGVQNVTFPNAYSKMAYIIFNPSTTTPAVATQPAHTGSKYAACFAAVPYGTDPLTKYNNDWMISRRMLLGTASSVEFWAKSATVQYGAERFNVLVSTTDTNPASFTVISGATYQTVPAEWTKLSYDLSAYNNQTIYVAIQCVSQDAFYFMVDDFTIYSDGGSDIEGGNTVTRNVLAQNYPNPFNPETTINFSLANSSSVKLAVYNAKGEFVKELISGVQTAGNHSVKFNAAGMNSGVYFYKLTTPERTLTQKMLLVK